jgi:hypothetical protein
MRMRRPSLERVLFAQGAYYVATGLAPFASRRAFEAVTGPKMEWWLVQTVGVLVTVVGGALISASARDRATPEVVGTAAGCAAGLAAVDTVYVARGRIAPSYLADAAIQVAVIAGLAAAGDGRRAATPITRRG